METICDHNYLEVVCVKLGFVGKLVIDKIGRNKGLCLFWSQNVEVGLLSFSRFYINVKIGLHTNKVWRYTGFYGHPEASQRIHSWTLLRRFQGMSILPRLYSGAFNEVLNDFEKSGRSPKQQHLIDNFRNVLNDCGFKDIGFFGPAFTWCNRRDDLDLIHEHIDRWVCILAWRFLFPSSQVRHLDFRCWGHRLVLMSASAPILTHPDRIFQGNRFHFEAYWVTNVHCLNLVKEAWGSSSGNSSASVLVFGIRNSLA
ncbi:hypothetical protein ACOSP7_031069 [Xanthoceras sorbifolium]